MKVFDLISDFYYGKILRKYDFVLKCCFFHQVSHYKNLKSDGGKNVEVPFKSDRIGIYNVSCERYNYMFDNTGQKNWYFKFKYFKK